MTPNKKRIGGVKVIISNGTVAIIKPFSVCIFDATNNPISEKRIDDNATPIMHKKIFCIFPKMQSSKLTKTPRVKSGKTFAITYSLIFIGETPKDDSNRWLFSKSTMAPIKNKPMAAGSEKIKITAVVTRAFLGMDSSKHKYKTDKIM